MTNLQVDVIIWAVSSACLAVIFSAIVFLIDYDEANIYNIVRGIIRDNLRPAEGKHSKSNRGRVRGWIRNQDPFGFGRHSHSFSQVR